MVRVEPELKVPLEPAQPGCGESLHRTKRRTCPEQDAVHPGSRQVGEEPDQVFLKDRMKQVRIGRKMELALCGVIGPVGPLERGIHPGHPTQRDGGKHRQAVAMRDRHELAQAISERHRPAFHEHRGDPGLPERLDPGV